MAISQEFHYSNYKYGSLSGKQLPLTAARPQLQSVTSLYDFSTTCRQTSLRQVASCAMD